MSDPNIMALALTVPEKKWLNMLNDPRFMALAVIVSEKIT